MYQRIRTIVYSPETKLSVGPLNVILLNVVGQLFKFDMFNNIQKCMFIGCKSLNCLCQAFLDIGTITTTFHNEGNIFKEMLE